MKSEILFQNLFNIFIIALILEAAISAIFSLSALKNMRETSKGKSIRDIVIIVAALFICLKVPVLTLFRGTGLKLPRIFDTIISALVLTRIANFIRDFFARIRESSQ